MILKMKGKTLSVPEALGTLLDDPGLCPAITSALILQQ